MFIICNKGRGKVESELSPSICVIVETVAESGEEKGLSVDGLAADVSSFLRSVDSRWSPNSVHNCACVFHILPRSY